jgi:phage N-6-adenine-methyltransferase
MIAEAKTRTRKVMTSSNTDEHYTPKEVIDAVLACFGSIDLDPCSNEPTDGSPNVPAGWHFIQEDDGLNRNWVALTLYMNPPYSDVKRWINKLTEEYESGHVQQAIALVKADPSTRWFQQIWESAEVVCFVDHRLRFHGTVKNSSAATFASAIAYFGSKPERFCDAFESLGPIVRVHRKSKEKAAATPL